MSYTFTSPVKNYNNKETLNHCSEIKEKINGTFEKSKSILMVGWEINSDASFVQHMLDNDKDLTIVELFPKNLESIISPNIKTMVSDIRDYVVDKNYDLFLWQHGPEYVNKPDVNNFLLKYEKFFHYIILESPNGPCAQDANYGNPYKDHVSAWNASDYLDLGFEYITYAGQSNDVFIIAYKTNENTVSS